MYRVHAPLGAATANASRIMFNFRRWLCVMLAAAFASVSFGQALSEPKAWCLSGGLYSGTTNLGLTSISWLEQRMLNSCNGSAVLVTDSCVGVLVGSPNRSETILYAIRRCMTV